MASHHLRNVNLEKVVAYDMRTAMSQYVKRLNSKKANIAKKKLYINLNQVNL